MRLWLVRHTPVNLPDGYCYGRADLELSPDWRTHFARTRRKLPAMALRGAAIYSSPLRRCLDLASSFSDAVRTDTRLIELDFGRWELRRWEDIPVAEIEAWSGDIYAAAPPGGETLNALHERSAQFLRAVAEDGCDLAIVVTHGGIIRSLLAHLLELPVANAFRLRIDFGGVSEARIDQQSVRIDYINR